MKQKHEKVVALIPCYNSRTYIRKAVEGLLKQKRKLDLIVVLDDCSTDHFEDELQDLLQNHDNLIIHRNEKNLGRSACRNEGFKKFPADFYILNDADDISLPDRVEKQLQFMHEHPHCGISGCYTQYIDEQGKVFGSGTNYVCYTEDEAKLYRRSLQPVCLGACIMCIRSEVVATGEILFDSTLDCAEDMEFCNIALEKGWDVLCQREYLLQYRFHSHSICTSNQLKCMRYTSYVADRLVRRRTHQAPISYETYIEDLRKEGFIRWFLFNYHIYTSHFYRTGGFRLLKKQYIQGAAMLSLALIMKPRLLPKLLKQRFGKRK